MNTIRIGSRESRLAVVQSELVQKYLLEQGIEAPIVTMKTTGDKILDKTLDQVGGKGLFVKELDAALLDGRSDISVHSLKDVPVEENPELPLIGYSQREDPRDVLVLPKGIRKLDQARPIGCSSRRRVLQAQRLYLGMRFQSVRGNVLTRLKKLDSGEYSALILAAAGLKRLGLSERISRYFTTEEMIPCAGQGILALQARKDLECGIFAGYVNKESEIIVKCEREFIRAVGGECSSPVAAHAVIQGEKIILRGMYSRGNGERGFVTGIKEGMAVEPEKTADALAEELMERFEEER
ncbi:MAG: hydroxymethylbilane synthase [Lachnospiraceae bacterium]|nr:hydroxymethylbilane synthase [Lachnospiraceae bacterium]